MVRTLLALTVTLATAAGADASSSEKLDASVRGQPLTLALYRPSGPGSPKGTIVIGSGDVGWRPRDWVWLRGRVIVLGVDPEDRPAYVTSSGVASSSFQLADGLAVHVVGEVDADEPHDVQARIFAILDFDGGGRFPVELTDVDPDSVDIGDRVTMTFRKLYTADGIHDYFWKAKPLRGVS